MIKKNIFFLFLLSSRVFATKPANVSIGLSPKTHVKNEDSDSRNGILTFVSNQTKRSYFIPTATGALFAGSLLYPLLFTERSKEGLKNAFGQLKNSFHELSKKDLALQLLKSLYVASTISSNDFVIELEEKYISLNKVAFLTLAGYYTWNTLTNSDDLTLNPALLEKLTENYAPLFTVESLAKAMHWTDEPVMQAEKISLTKNDDHNKIVNVVCYTLFVLGWERLIKKSPLNRDFLKKMIYEFFFIYALSIPDHSQSNIKSSILQAAVWYMLLTSIYKASIGTTGLSKLENVLPATPSLETITGLIGKDFFVPMILYNNLLKAINEYIFDKKDNDKKVNSDSDTLEEESTSR